MSAVGKRVNAKPVIDGRRIKWTLEQSLQSSGEAVRVDTLRVTLPLGAVVKSDRQLDPDLSWMDCLDKRGRDLMVGCMVAEADLHPSGAMAVAQSGAKWFCELVGGLTPGIVEDRGLDYYTVRCPLIFEEQTVGYVLAGGKQSAQAGTVHFDIRGEACLHISHEKWQAVRQWIIAEQGRITRVDLAVDVFTGDDVVQVQSDYLAGRFDVLGKRPTQTNHGSWALGHSRTFEVGRRQTGKLLRAYEKGDELFGPEAADPWVRYEVELRNVTRIIDPDVLSRPADFFAGAYEFCDLLLQRLNVAATAQRIKTGQRDLVEATAEAAVSKAAKWFAGTAAPTFCKLLMEGGELLEWIFERESHRVPGRLKGFDKISIRNAFEKVAAAFAPAASPSFTGA